MSENKTPQSVTCLYNPVGDGLPILGRFAGDLLLQHRRDVLDADFLDRHLQHLLVVPWGKNPH